METYTADQLYQREPQGDVNPEVLTSGLKNYSSDDLYAPKEYEQQANRIKARESMVEPAYSGVSGNIVNALEMVDESLKSAQRVGAALVVGMGGQIVAGIGALGEYMNAEHEGVSQDERIRRANETLESISSKTMSVMPLKDEDVAAMGNVMWFFDQTVGRAGRAVGDKLLETTGSPDVAAIGASATEAGIYFGIPAAVNRVRVHVAKLAEMKAHGIRNVKAIKEASDAMLKIVRDAEKKVSEQFGETADGAIDALVDSYAEEFAGTFAEQGGPVKHPVVYGAEPQPPISEGQLFKGAGAGMVTAPDVSFKPTMQAGGPATLTPVTIAPFTQVKAPLPSIAGETQVVPRPSRQPNFRVPTEGPVQLTQKPVYPWQPPPQRTMGPAPEFAATPSERGYVAKITGILDDLFNGRKPGKGFREVEAPITGTTDELISAFKESTGRVPNNTVESKVVEAPAKKISPVLSKEDMVRAFVTGHKTSTVYKGLNEQGQHSWYDPHSGKEFTTSTPTAVDVAATVKEIRQANKVSEDIVKETEKRPEVGKDLGKAPDERPLVDDPFTETIVDNDLSQTPLSGEIGFTTRETRLEPLDEAPTPVPGQFFQVSKGKDVPGLGVVKSITPDSTKPGEFVVNFIEGSPRPSMPLTEVKGHIAKLAEQSGFVNLEMFGVPQLIERLQRHIDAVKNGVPGFVKFMEGIGRIVPDYVKGSGELPIRQRPSIPGSVPVVAKDVVPIMGAIRSPHYTAKRSLPNIQDSFVIDGMESHMAFSTNIKNALKWANDTLSGVKDMSVTVEKTMGPLFREYWPKLKEYAALIDKKQEMAREATKFAKGSPQQLAAEAALKQARVDLKNAHASMDPFLLKYDQLVIDLARQHSDVRVALHAADMLEPSVGDKFIYMGKKQMGEIVMGKEEVATANKIRQYMEKSKEELQALGIPTLEKKAYMMHLWRNLLDDEGAAVFIGKLKGTPSVLTFLSRMPESRMWMPSAHAVMDAYIPVIERKLAYQPFLNRWNQLRSTESPNLRAFLFGTRTHDGWIGKNLFKTTENIFEKGLNGLVTIEYMRLIGLSLSVGFKHLLKLANTWSSQGFISSVEAMALMAKVPAQGALKKLGIKGSFDELRAFRAFVTQKALVRTMDEIPALRTLLMDKLRFFTGQPVIAVEALDNGVSVLASIINGMKKDIPKEIIQRQIWETILDANFRANWDQPLWGKNTGMRAVTMFSMTPFKLTEFRWELLKRAFRWEKDAYGSLYATKLLRYLTIVGGAELVARQYGTSIADLFVHPPFFRHIVGTSHEFPYFKLHQPKFAASPIIDLAVKMKDKGVVGGGYEHFSKGGTYERFQKAAEGEYSSDWYDTPEQMLLTLPNVGAGEAGETGSRGGRGRSGRGGRHGR